MTLILRRSVIQSEEGVCLVGHLTVEEREPTALFTGSPDALWDDTGD